jgi:hypothetical protein
MRTRLSGEPLTRRAAHLRPRIRTLLRAGGAYAADSRRTDVGANGVVDPLALVIAELGDLGILFIAPKTARFAFARARAAAADEGARRARPLRVVAARFERVRRAARGAGRADAATILVRADVLARSHRRPSAVRTCVELPIVAARLAHRASSPALSEIANGGAGRPIVGPHPVGTAHLGLGPVATSRLRRAHAAACASLADEGTRRGLLPGSLFVARLQVRCAVAARASRCAHAGASRGRAHVRARHAAAPRAARAAGEEQIAFAFGHPRLAKTDTCARRTEKGTRDVRLPRSRRSAGEQIAPRTCLRSDGAPDVDRPVPRFHHVRRTGLRGGLRIGPGFGVGLDGWPTLTARKAEIAQNLRATGQRNARHPDEGAQQLA